MNREVAHEKEQRTIAIDDLYKKLGDYEQHKFKQLVKDGVEIKFTDEKKKEDFHVLTHSKDRRMGSSSSGSGKKKGKKGEIKMGKNGKGLYEIQQMMKHGMAGGGVGTQGHIVDP